MVSQGQHGAALDRVNAYLAVHPKDVSGQFLKGVILAEQNKPAEAIRIFTTITEKHPELPEPYNNLAVLYAEQKQYDKARQSLERAIKTHPSYATAHENLGDIYAKMASDAYDKALQLDRSNSRAETKLAMVKELFSGATTGRTEPKPDGPATSAASPGTAEAAKPVETKPRPGQAPAVKEDKLAPVEADVQKAVLDAVQDWARAWSSRDVDAYLAWYADSFKTPNGESRGEWQNNRRERIRRPSSIEVEVQDPKVVMEGDRATVAFRQSYRADGNSMSTSKTLHLKKSGERWLITQEIAGR